VIQRVQEETTRRDILLGKSKFRVPAIQASEPPGTGKPEKQNGTEQALQNKEETTELRNDLAWEEKGEKRDRLPGP